MNVRFAAVLNGKYRVFFSPCAILFPIHIFFHAASFVFSPHVTAAVSASLTGCSVLLSDSFFFSAVWDSGVFLVVSTIPSPAGNKNYFCFIYIFFQKSTT